MSVKLKSFSFILGTRPPPNPRKDDSPFPTLSCSNVSDIGIIQGNLQTETVTGLNCQGMVKFNRLLSPTLVSLPEKRKQRDQRERLKKDYTRTKKEEGKKRKRRVELKKENSGEVYRFV